MMDSAPRHALVTGASSGIGAAIVDRLLADGWQVTGVSRRPTERPGAAFRSVAADLAVAADRARVIAGAGPVTAFVHAAGFLETARLGTLDAAAGARMWQLHVAAAEHIADGLAPHLPEGGRIVLVGSRTATGAAGRSQYAASKAALTGMVRSWAIELAPRKITVNVVAPAATDTPMLADPARATTPPKLPPMGRFIAPREVAATVAFLLGPDAAMMTGQTLVICGGSSL